MGELRLEGRPASPGFAAGVLQVFGRPASAEPPVGRFGQDAEALRDAIAAAARHLEALASSLDGDAADMVGFQVAMLDDPALSEAAFEAVAGGAAAANAWSAAMNAEIAGYSASNDEYFRARAGDLADIRDRVLVELGGEAMPRIRPGGIVVASDLAPSLLLSTDWTGGGIALLHGSATSHVAMLARSRGIPMVVSLGEAAADLLDGMPVLLDGGAALLVANPTEAARRAFDLRRRQRSVEMEAAQAGRMQPARMADGAPVAVLLNIADPAELAGLEPDLCDGIGLVRTELLFEGSALPGEEAQLDVYLRILRWAGGRPVTVRTLDAGGDKPIAGVTLERETNPFLGVRGVRLSLRHLPMFKLQLRALARAAAEGPLEVMVPMVSVPAEIDKVRALLDEACRELEAEGRAHRRPPLGIMVEVPAVAVAPERFDADFYSIGSNDLVQYTLAAGRDAAALADLAQPTDPSVLRLIANVVAHGARLSRKVSLCGDAGGNPAVIPHLLGAGLRILSMAPGDVAEAKRAIAACHPGPVP